MNPASVDQKHWKKLWAGTRDNNRNRFKLIK